MQGYTVSQVLATFPTLKKRGNSWEGECPVEKDGTDRFWVKAGPNGSASMSCRSCMGQSDTRDKTNFKALIALLDAAHGKKPFVSHSCTRLCVSFKLVQPVKAHGSIIAHRKNAGESGKSKSWAEPRLGNRPKSYAQLHKPDGDYEPGQVVTAEGSKSAYAVVDAGYQALSWNGGTSGVAYADFSCVSGKHCIIWPDADVPGVKCVAALAQKLLAAGALSVRVVDIGMMPGVNSDDLPKSRGKDTADVDVDLRRSMVESAKEYEAPEPAELGDKNSKHGQWDRTPNGDAKRLLTRHSDILLVVWDPADQNRATLRVLDAKSGVWREDAPLLGRLLLETARAWDYDGFSTAESDKVRMWALRSASPEGQQRALASVGVAYREMESENVLPARLTECRRVQLDGSGRYLGTPSGVLDVTTGEVLSPAESRRKLVTMLLPDEYDPDASHTGVEKVLSRLGSRERDWLMASMGHALRGYCNERIYILHGEGNAGKSTLVGAAVDSLGEYAATMPSNALKPSTFSEAGKAEPYKFKVAGGSASFCVMSLRLVSMARWTGR